MNNAYHVYIREIPRGVEYSNLNVNRIDLIEWLSKFESDYQIELKVTII